jgi:glycosyltransferase involved in cell wall biosynthesis
MNLLITAISSATGPSGICRHAYGLARCAVSRGGIQVTLALGKWQEMYFKRSFDLEALNVSLVSVNISNDAFARNMWYLRGLPKLAAELAADIVHLSFPVPVRRRSMRCPVVVSLHDLYPYDEPNNFGFPRVYFNRVFLHECVREVDCVACVSEITLSQLKTRFPRLAHRKSVVVHNCVAIDWSEPMLPVGLHGKFFLMVAQHRANKNILLALKVFEELLHRKSIDQRTLMLLIGNEGPETAAIRSFIEKRSLEASVRLINGVTDGELRWLYENCEVLMVPSLMEGFGLPLAEGLFCGSRIVCSDIPAFREIGGDACHYFDLHADSDSSAMIEAVCKALSGPAKRARGLERFVPGNIAREYAAIYSHLREDALVRTQT